MGQDSDDSFGHGIETVDATTFASRKQILFVVSAGNGHCLTLGVFTVSGQSQSRIWELDELPGGRGGICHEQMLGYPTAFARAPGDIVVQVPTGPAYIVSDVDRKSSYPISTALAQYTYRWNGSTFKLAKAEEISTFRSDILSAERCTIERPCPHP
jgi:hypothetical protein